MIERANLLINSCLCNLCAGVVQHVGCINCWRIVSYASLLFRPYEMVRFCGVGQVLLVADVLRPH